MIEARAPGKLFVVGEYAVVTPGEPAVLVAVDRYLTVRIETGAGRRRRGYTTSGHVRAALSAVEELRAARGLGTREYGVHTHSELNAGDGRKLGLGSSAAVVVATVAALNELYGLGLSATERFRLALLATIEISPNASGGDIAAATYGGWIRYTSPDRAALRRARRAGGIQTALTSPGWDPAALTRLEAPRDVRLLVGWTGSPASTDSLVGGVRKAPTGGATDPDFLAASRSCITDLVACEPDAALAAIRRARANLAGLARVTGIEIETPLLRTACDIADAHGGAGKPSGAGGGDCVIALVPTRGDAEGILQGWRAQGITPLDLGVDLRAHPRQGDTRDH